MDLPNVVPDILVEQRGFYRADAVQSDRWLSSLIDPGNDDADARTYRSGRQRIADLLSAIGPLGRVLEIAAGTGRLAEVYLPLADEAVLVDSSPESLALATDRLHSTPGLSADVELIEADIFDWDSGERTFNTILFSAWFHHVPHDVFDRFWGRVERLLAPGGVVVFDFLDARMPSPGRVDIPEAPTEDYTFYAPVDGVSVRDLGGRRWRVVHNLWRPDDLARRLHGHGWDLTVVGPGLLSNMVWATAHRVPDDPAGRRAQSDRGGELTGDANLGHMNHLPEHRADDELPRWQLDEIANAGRENLDVDHVTSYDHKEDAHAGSEIALLTSLGLDERSTVVDLGAGTGQFALAAASRCARVVAVDISPVMLDVLRSKISDPGASNLEVVQAGFLTYEHSGAKADFVYTRWALHHLPDFWKTIALTRMRAILEPGGTLRLSDIAYSFQPSEAAERVEQWCDTVPAQAPEVEWVRADIEDHVRDEHSTYTWILEPMIERCGFRIDRSEHSTDGVYATYIATAT